LQRQIEAAGLVDDVSVVKVSNAIAQMTLGQPVRHEVLFDLLGIGITLL
jgi:hypothetical protein